MPQAVPAIYSGPSPAPQVTLAGRFAALLVSGGCLALLLTAAWLHPSPAGVSTHTGLGLPSCQFLARTGIPCVSCGMTTSFSWFVRGNLLASLYVQPMGTVLAAMCAITVWAGLYIALTGKPLARLLRLIPPRYYIAPLMTWTILAWGWKIFIHLRGIDGWR
ncbi:MAG TPA: DUF2752 domain-containing protein [Tepidisphaeraceae bacterium]|nr:DUF2752 domain-containing protein [Tepidisphaeraceae bacterium]